LRKLRLSDFLTLEDATTETPVNLAVFHWRLPISTSMILGSSIRNMGT